jgi:hypothetical protein
MQSSAPKELPAVYRQFDPDYHNRAGVDEILAHLPE